MTHGKGIAIAGIWLGVGLSAFGAGGAVAFVALFAYFATMAIAE